MKEFVWEIDPVPTKRTLRSIIADYDLNRAVCELIDNGLDEWTKSGRNRNLVISISADVRQQTLCITDNAGGVHEKHIDMLVGPGHSGNAADAETIGLFGVGTKRAVVALAQTARIRSRFGKRPTYQVEIDEQWLTADDSWKLSVYRVDNISPASTQIELSQLRMELTEDGLARLQAHLSATYALFLSAGGVSLTLNGPAVQPQTFEDWAYPPDFEPRQYNGSIPLEEGGEVKVVVTAGLTRQSSPTGEFGVYFYCNQRLIGRALRTREVGFARGLAGPAHPMLSLVRVVVHLTGPARAMPWNSSKSDLHYNHAVFLKLRDWLATVLADYAKLSRNWASDWESNVFQHSAGKIVQVRDVSFEKLRTYLPPLPAFRPRFVDRVANANEKLFRKKPYARGLAEGLVAADQIQKGKLTQRNRIALILLDSTLEIAFKDYLVHVSGTPYSDSTIVSLFGNRSNVHKEVKKTKPFDKTFWDNVALFYKHRCKLVHERATASIPDHDLQLFRETVERALRELIGLRFSRVVWMRPVLAAPRKHLLLRFPA